MDPILVQHILNWLALGSIYTLVAIGFSLLFGVLNIIHFSHGDVSMIAPFALLGLVPFLTAGVPSGGILFLMCFLAAGFVGLVGILLDKTVIQRFRAAPAMMALVATVALGGVVRELIRALVPQGSNPKAFPALFEGRLEMGDISVPVFSLAAIGFAIVLTSCIFWMLARTTLGIYIRAVAEDRDIARLMSIRPSHVFAATFFIASFIGGIGGLFHAAYAGVVRFDFGIQLGLIGFSAAVVGGLGSMQGAIIGSLLIAGIDILIQLLIPNGASWRLVAIFVLVIFVLVLRPEGILGKPVIEKV